MAATITIVERSYLTHSSIDQIEHYIREGRLSAAAQDVFWMVRDATRADGCGMPPNPAVLEAYTKGGFQAAIDAALAEVQAPLDLSGCGFPPH